MLERRILPKVWGGTGLRDVLGIALPGPEPVGESWELFDRPDGASLLRGRDQTLADWMREDPSALLGRGVLPTPDGRFPLLMKFLDARRALSLQVHPDGALAARDGDGSKAEAWVVLAAGERARILRGFRSGVSREDVERAIRSPQIVDLVHEFKPAVGDVIDVPPGMVHSIGPDVVVFEVQQNSDLTYRIFDWGRPRELHVERALEALRLHPCEPATRTPQALDADTELLTENAHFRVTRIGVTVPRTLETGGRFAIVSVIAGFGMLGWRSGGDHEPLSLVRGDTVLIPACVDAVFLSPAGRFDVLCTTPGGPS